MPNTTHTLTDFDHELPEVLKKLLAFEEVEAFPKPYPSVEVWEKKHESVKEFRENVEKEADKLEKYYKANNDAVTEDDLYMLARDTFLKVFAMVDRDDDDLNEGKGSAGERSYLLMLYNLMASLEVLGEFLKVINELNAMRHRERHFRRLMNFFKESTDEARDMAMEATKLAPYLKQNMAEYLKPHLYNYEEFVAWNELNGI